MSMEFLSWVKSGIPLRIKRRLAGWLRAEKLYLSPMAPGRRRLVVALAADYGNLGDVALTYALVQFAKKNAPDCDPVYLPARKVFVSLNSLRRQIGPDDIIALVGGGNMGDMYEDLEDARRAVIAAFPRHRVVSFPQTIDFSETSAGRRELQRSEQVYAAHPDLRIFAREQVSFEEMRRVFPKNRVELVPDTVLSLDLREPVKPRSGLVICLRSDREARMDSAARAGLIDALIKAHPGTVVTDTHIGMDGWAVDAYHKPLNDLWEIFRGAECVVTDRLHGMIFAAITGTPCLVFENSNHKIHSTWETWLKAMPSIRIQKSLDPVEALAAANQVKAYPGLHPALDVHYESLAAALKR